jgi:excisionase family DNA binding protein
MSTETDTLLTADDVAAMLGVSKSWVERAVKRNELPVIRLGRYIRFRRESVEEWVKGQERRAG